MMTNEEIRRSFENQFRDWIVGGERGELLNINFPIVDHIGDCQMLTIRRDGTKFVVSDNGWLHWECESVCYEPPKQVMESLLARYDAYMNEECIQADAQTPEELFWAVSNLSAIAVVLGWMRSFKMTSEEVVGGI